MSSASDSEYPTGFQPAAAVFVVLFSSSAILLIPPIVAQTRSRNLPIVTLLVALLIASVFRVVNALLWGSDTGTWWSGNLLCDVEVRMFAMIDLVIGGAAICISRDLLYSINTQFRVKASREAQHLRTALHFLMWCIVIPGVRAGLQYVVSPERYEINIIHGCTVVLDDSWPTIALYTTWPCALAAIVVYYQVLLLLSAAKYTPEISRIFGTSHGRLCDAKLKRMFKLVLWIDTLYFFGLVLLSVVTAQLPLLHSYSWTRMHKSDYWDFMVNMSYTPPLWLLLEDVSLGLVTLFIAIRLGLDPETKLVYRQGCRLVRYDIPGKLNDCIRRKSKTKSATPLSPTYWAERSAPSNWRDSNSLRSERPEGARYMSELTTFNSVRVSHPGTSTRTREIELADNESQDRITRFTELA